MSHIRFPDFSQPLPARPRVIALVEQPKAPAPGLAIHALRRTGELLGAVLLIAGGCGLVGLATLI